LRGVYTKESVFSIDNFSKETLKVSPQYASCAEAALQQLKVVGSGRLGINDRISLIKRLKTRIHILPLVMVSIFALGFLSHYVYIKSSFWRYSSRIEKLKTQKSQLSANISALKDIKSRIRNAYGQKHYIERLPVENERLSGLFNAIAEVIPYDVILDKIAQDEDGSNGFSIEGAGLSADSITKFTGDLERLEVTRGAKLQSINEKKVVPESERLFLYAFKIKVVLK
jgi:Tfp pilus assembly protein PilN